MFDVHRCPNFISEYTKQIRKHHGSSSNLGAGPVLASHLFDRILPRMGVDFALALDGLLLPTAKPILSRSELRLGISRLI